MNISVVSVYFRLFRYLSCCLAFCTNPLWIDLGDFDGDNNLDLRVKFSREALAALLDQTIGQEAVVRLNWLYTNGGEGSASAQVRIIR
ncbi:MAG: hypothetical protein KF868_13215 [Acidobacteria bacterium]|nr:hypothetical protein [Acidobacteriota bacterium]MCW5970625.1 hypothetical protein [Blastocatellales bacterium]